MGWGERECGGRVLGMRENDVVSVAFVSRDKTNPWSSTPS
jgi:hypothetical protein